jgi:hypothetical protein
VSEPARRDIGGPPVVIHRPLRAAAPGILVGQLARDRVRILGAQQFQSLGDATVQQPPPGGVHPGVGGLAEQVVGKVISVAEFPQDPKQPQFVDRAHDSVSVQVTGLGEQIESEICPYRSRQAGYLPGRRARLLQSLMQHCRKVTRRQRRAAQIGAAAHCLDHEQREATRGGVQQFRVSFGKRLAGNGAGEPCGVVSLQRAEPKLGQHSGGPHLDDPVSEVGSVATAVAAGGAGHQQLGAVSQRQAERDERQRLLVAPLQVIQHEKQRPADRVQRPGQAFEEPMPLPSVRHRPRAARRHALVACRHEPADFSPPHGAECSSS